LGTHHHPVFESFREPWVGPVCSSKNDPKGFGMSVNTAWAVCTLLEHERSLIGIMERAIEWGGDVGSVCSIAWGIASARYLNEALPGFMERDLEPNGGYGAEFLRELGKRLNDAYA
jgi:hypothetical protein